MPRRVVVVHFNPPNLDKRLAKLSGFEVDTVVPKGPAELKPLRERPPDAFVVDLDRRPSEGRSVAVQLRRYASTRPVPLVFAGGEADQVARVRNLLPDAIYVSWQGVLGGLKRAKPLEKPVVPSPMDAYSQTQLEPKLGVRDSTTMLLIGAPEGFGKALRRAELVEEGPVQIVMLFVPDAAELDAQFAAAKAAIASSGSAGRRRRRASSPTSASARFAAMRWSEAWSTSRSPRSTRRGQASASPARSSSHVQRGPVRCLAPKVAAQARADPPKIAPEHDFVANKPRPYSTRPVPGTGQVP